MELIAPAGSWEALEACVDAGADAVYASFTEWNARHRASNFSREEMVRAIDYAHGKGALLYLA